MTSGGAAKRDEVSAIRLWPPAERTRLHVAARMTENLKSLSINYTPLDESEAATLAKRVEELAFLEGERETAAAAAFPNNGSSAVRIYAKQASRLMLQVLRSGGKLPEDTTENRSSQVSTLSQDVEDGGTVVSTDDVSKQDIFDISGGVRDILHKDNAVKLFRPLEEGVQTQIRLSDWAFTVEAAMAAAEVLSMVKYRITKADLSDIVAGRPETEAREVWSILSRALEGSNLSYLDLSNNALGEKGVRAFGALLKSQKHLKELFFMNDGISSDAAKAIVELLPSGKDLKTLHFHNNMSGRQGAETLAKLIREADGLEDFRFSSSRVDSKGGIALAEALKSGVSLRKLDLRDNMFGPKAGMALAAAVKQHKSIQELYLADLNLKNEAVTVLLEGISDGIQVLDLGNNGIRSEAAGHVASCLAKMKFLKKVVLQENPIRDGGVVVICKALEVDHEELEELDLTQTSCRDDGAIAAAKAVVNKPHFKKLILESNHISEDALETVNSILGNKASVLVPMEDNYPDEEDVNDDDDDEDDDGDEDDEDGNDEEEDEAKERSGDSEELQAKLGSLSV